MEQKAHIYTNIAIAAPHRRRFLVYALHCGSERFSSNVVSNRFRNQDIQRVGNKKKTLFGKGAT